MYISELLSYDVALITSIESLSSDVSDKFIFSDFLSSDFLSSDFLSSDFLSNLEIDSSIDVIESIKFSNSFSFSNEVISELSFDVKESIKLSNSV